MKLEQLHEKIKKSRKNPLSAQYNAVPGEGPENAKIMLIGQNPGKQENETGRPFIGRSGQLLTRTLEKCGIERSKVFVTSVGKYGTPDNRLPTKEEVAFDLPFLEEQIKIIKPKKILLMGALARAFTPRIEGIEYFETIHPAAVLRFPNKFKDRFENDIKKLK